MEEFVQQLVAQLVSRLLTNSIADAARKPCEACEQAI
jgi:hypothetical protein